MSIKDLDPWNEKPLTLVSKLLFIRIIVWIISQMEKLESHPEMTLLKNRGVLKGTRSLHRFKGEWKVKRRVK